MAVSCLPAALARRPQRLARPPARIRINLALQGGGAHGAFTWGVLDRLLEEPDLELVGISGASAGAVNGVVVAHGLARGGHPGGQRALAAFWERVAAAGSRNAFAPSPLERALGLAALGLAAGPLWLAGVARLASPYALNPSGHNPLADLLAESVDFAALRRASPVRLFVGATNVRSGKPRIFGPEEIGLEAVLASACLPTLFHAVEIGGEHYWDGGYATNPPVLPLLEGTDCEDTLIVQIDPIRIDELPTSAWAIRDRLHGLGFNAAFMREMQAIATLAATLDGAAQDRGARQGRGLLATARRLAGRIRQLGRRRLRLHMIEAGPEMARLGTASKLDTDRASLGRLAALGRAQARSFLAEHKAALGVRSSLDVAARFL